MQFAICGGGGEGEASRNNAAARVGIVILSGEAVSFAALGAVAGAAVGSFLGAALVRLPEGRSVVTGRSACDGCGRTIAVRDLVPLVSFIRLHGRCRDCGAAIGYAQPLLEAGGLVVGGVGGWLAASDPLTGLFVVVLGWQAILLAALDARHFWLPLRLVGLLAGTGLAGAGLLAWQEGDSARVMVALTGGLLGWGTLKLVSLAYRQMRRAEGMGAADPPMLGALGLWLGPLGVIETLLGASLIGLLAAAVMLLAGRRVAADTALPLGSCLAAAAWPLFVLQGFG